MTQTPISAQARAFLESKYDINVAEGPLEIADANSWNALCARYGSAGRGGMFFPRTMAAIIHPDSSANQSVILHEDIGHRLFFEQTPQGIALRDLDLRVDALEKLVLGDAKDGSGLRFEFIPSESPGVRRVGKDSLGRVMIWHNPLDALVGQLRNTSSIKEEVYVRIWPIAEEFADYVANFVGKEMGINGDHQINQSRNRFCQINQSSGPITSLYSTGIKRTRRNDIMFALLKEHYKDLLTQASLVVRYGSNNPQSDIDFFAVAPSAVASEIRKVSTPSYLDLIVIDEDEFNKGIIAHDVQYTIPILEGEILYGKENIENAIAKCTTPCEPELFRKRALVQMQRAIDYSRDCLMMYERLASTGDDLTASGQACQALVNLSYAAMYQFQLRGPHSIASSIINMAHFKDAVLSDPLLGSLRHHLKEAAHDFRVYDHRFTKSCLLQLSNLP